MKRMFPQTRLILETVGAPVKRQRTAALQDAVAMDCTLHFPRGFGVRLSSAAFLIAIVFLTAVFSFAQEPGAFKGHKPVIVLVGDSTVTDTSGWGLGFKRFLNDRAECTNTAANGRSSKSFINEGRWKKALAIKGDYYLIQFGHNDEHGKGPERETDANTTYHDFMARYVNEARAIGAKPVLVTSLVRRQWDKSGNGKINSSLVPYVEAVKRLAAEKNVSLIDLHARSKELCEQLGKEKCIEFSPLKNTNEVDNTHLHEKGSVLFGQLVMEELVKVAPELKVCFREGPLSPSDGEREKTEPLGNQTVNGSSKTLESKLKIYNVRHYGAVGDGKTLDTAAIQKALDECGNAGGGTVLVPAGNYLSKPIILRNNLTLQLEEGATLKATDEPADFADPKEEKGVIAFVNGKNLTNITIAGKGTIDGAGERWWPPVKEAKKTGQPEPRRRPRMVVLSKCKGVQVQAVTLQNSPSFHLVPTDCEDVVIDNVTIRAPDDSPNTDAIDPSACKNVLIRKCILDVGDDNVALKSGRSVPGRSAACEDITVVDCTFLHGHGMSIGSETVGGVRNLTVRNCTFKDTVSGLRIKSYRGRGGLVENVTYSDIKMTNVKIPINITSYYPKIPKEDTAQPVTAETPIYRNIRIANLTATSPQSAGYIVGLPECVVSNVALENVQISAPIGLTVRNAKEIRVKNVKIDAAKGEPFVLENASVEGEDSGK
jgi:polygalacturonase/lysophospholipase L1-like esterase